MEGEDPFIMEIPQADSTVIESLRTKGINFDSEELASTKIEDSIDQIKKNVCESDDQLLAVIGEQMSALCVENETVMKHTKDLIASLFRLNSAQQVLMNNECLNAVTKLQKVEASMDCLRRFGQTNQ